MDVLLGQVHMEIGFLSRDLIGGSVFNKRHLSLLLECDRYQIFATETSFSASYLTITLRVI